MMTTAPSWYDLLDVEPDDRDADPWQDNITTLVTG